MFGLILGARRRRRHSGDIGASGLDADTQLILQDLLSVRAHADMRTNTHTALILAGLVASGAFAGGMVSAGPDNVHEFALLFLLMPMLYVVAFSLYLDVSRSVYLAEEYVNLVASQAFPQVWRDGKRVAWYWERFASEGRRPLYMKVVGGFKVGAAFVVPTAGSLAAFWYFRPPSCWTWYETLLFSTDVVAISLLVVAGELVHHLGRPVTSPEEKIALREKLRRFFL